MPGEASFKEGAVVYFERDSSGEVYLLRSGQVELVREVPGSTSRRLGAGEMVGLADSLGGGNRIETARAISDTTATVIAIEELRNMLTSNVQIGLKVITSLCSELREIDEMIVLRMRGSATDMSHVTQGLLMIAEHFANKGMIRAARYSYGRYLEENPDSDDYCDVALQLAALCEKDGDAEIALNVYESLRERFGDEPRVEAARSRLAGIMENFAGF